MVTIFTGWLIGAIVAAVIVVVLRYMRSTQNPPKLDTTPVEMIFMVVAGVCLIVWLVQTLSSLGV